MFQIETTEKFKKSYNKLNGNLQKAAKNKNALFQKNPKYPSLNCEKLEPKHWNLWSFRVDKKYRVIFQFKDNQTVLLWNITNHYQYS